jgi:NAD(P)-dependent dehydrogenase (short-subunit alcohol dehydrogenase family)
MLSAASTYAPKNIRVNCVAPGLTRTPLAGAGGRRAGGRKSGVPLLCAHQTRRLQRLILHPRPLHHPPGRITSSPAALKASEGMHALKRVGEPGEVAAALEFLLAPANSFVSRSQGLSVPCSLHAFVRLGVGTDAWTGGRHARQAALRARSRNLRLPPIATRRPVQPLTAVSPLLFCAAQVTGQVLGVDGGLGSLKPQ